MTTKIRVKAKKQWSEAERRLARAAATFATHELALDVSPIPIHIVLKGKNEQDFGDSIDLGYKVVVRINKSANWLGTLFHELEHARQYVYCELELETDHVIWRGTLSDRDADNYEEYWHSPWEVEARQKERELFAAFQKNLLT